MISSRTVRAAVLAVVVVLACGGCYGFQAQQAKDNGTPVPWFCNPTAPNSVTGPGMGSVNYYAGVARGPLGYDQCIEVGGQMDAAKSYAKQYPTLGSAEAAGFRSTFAFIPGMGTHHGRGSITPELLADPSFDRLNPIIPGTNAIDGVFDPARPEFLQYNGNGASAVLIGMSYYVRTTTGQPPAGFVGTNDWWHHHPTLCLNPSTAQAFAVNTTDAECANRSGINVHMDDYFMLHVWLVDNLEYRADVHAPMHPCIVAGGAIFDMANPCHTSATRSSTQARSGDAGSTAALFCPIGRLED